ncbi:MAG TPA: amino acid ABC transporter permease [Anaerolineae bacterium]|nr:amino acid ABC transporter permease [Anaerolineae bacterium]
MTIRSDTLAPPDPPGLVTWVKKNLFGNWFSSLLTLVSLTIIYFAVIGAVSWVFNTADWRPVIRAPLLYLIGQYPRDQIWRTGLSLWISTFLIGMSWGVWEKYIKAFAIFLAILLGIFAVIPLDAATLTLGVRASFLINPVLIYVGYLLGKSRFIRSQHVTALWLLASILIVLVILPGFNGNTLLPKVETTVWGGFLVTLLLAVGGIVLSFPIGVLLALGRRSSLPVVKLFSILFIEVIRGVPLITILFMFSIILALFLPAESRIDRVLRALIGMTVFSAAYMAENVRGGLQSIPPGQVEAAKAIGLSSFQTMTLIVLPQALRAVIPSIVGQFISLFKDTTLVVIVGINDLLGMGKSILGTDPEFVRLQGEVYIFIALIYWIFSYFMSYASLQLEKSLGVGER